MTGKPQTCTHSGCSDRPTARRLCRKHYQAAWKADDLGVHEKQPPRAKDPKTCPPGHKHGESLTCYNLHQCRCEPCSQHRRDTEIRRKKDKAFGRYDSALVDVRPVREHVLMLGEFGIGYKRVAMLAGYRSSTPVRTIIWGRQDPGPRYGEMQKRVKRETAQRILAIKPIVDNLGPGQKISSKGTVRRIQALVVAGWSLSKIARRLGLLPSNLATMAQRDQVLVSTFLAVRDLYVELWDQQPPQDEWRDKIAAARSKNYAKSRGWLPPLAWDDIDTDPVPPALDDAEQSNAERILEDVEWLLDAGEPAEQIAASLGRTLGSISKLAERHGRIDLARPFGAADQRRSHAA